MSSSSNYSDYGAAYKYGSSRPSAQIVDTVAPHSTWSDVRKVSFDGVYYTLGEMIKTYKGQYGKIIAFRSEEVEIMITLGPGREIHNFYTYGGISPAAGHKVNPNTAFKNKIRGRF